MEKAERKRLVITTDERLEIGVDKIVDFAVENGVHIGFFVFSAGVFDEFIGLHDVVADLLTPTGGFAST